MDYYIALDSATPGDTVINETTDSTSTLAIVVDQGVTVTVPGVTFEYCLEVFELRRLRSVGVITRDSSIIRSWYVPLLGLVRSHRESWTVWSGSESEFHGESETLILGQ